MSQAHLAGYLRRDSQSPIWWPVSKHDDNDLYTADSGFSVFANTEEEGIEQLSNMFPLPHALRNYSSVACRVFRGCPVNVDTPGKYDFWRPNRLIITEALVFSGDEDQLLEILEHVDCVLLPNQHLQDARDEWPAAGGYHVELWTPPRYDLPSTTQSVLSRRRRGGQDADEKLIRLSHDENRVNRHEAAMKAVATRKAINKDDLVYFMEMLHNQLPFTLADHGRGRSWNSSYTNHITSQIEVLLGIYEGVYGKHAYRGLQCYRDFMTKVIATERSTLAKYAGDRISDWLIVELRSNAVRLIRRGKHKDQYPSDRITKPFRRCENQLADQERKRIADEKESQKEETIDRWAWIGEGAAKKEKEEASGRPSGRADSSDAGSEEEKEEASGQDANFRKAYGDPEKEKEEAATCQAGAV